MNSTREEYQPNVKRKCRYCGGGYVVPRWSKSLGCPSCAPRLTELIKPEAGDSVRSRPL
jgi:hypothetical protein